MPPKLLPSPAYKHSGVEWLGDVPAHWDLVPNRGLMTLKKEVVGPRADDYVLLSLTKRGIIARDIEKSEGKFPASFETYQVVEPGDLVFCLFDIDETPRTVGLSNIHGMITGAYSRFVCSDEVLRRFLYYLYLSLDDGKLLKPLYSGLRKVIPKFTFLRAKVALPPRSEQAAIVGYLDHVDRRIQHYIEAKERLIALLQEARQAIIHRAVTRGLDPNVPLKSSGVGWLGDVPAHWDVRRLRYLAHITTGERDTIDRKDDGNYPFFVRSQNVERIDTWSFDGEAVLTAGDGVGVGRVFHYVDGKFDFHQRVYKFSNFRNVIGKFFFHYFRATLRFEVLQGTAKSTVDSLRLPMLQNLPVVLPPLTEQRAIAAHLDKATVAIDAAIDNARRQVEFMTEYRASLIAHVVTGKVDVRTAAASLSPESAEQEPVGKSPVS